MHKRFVNYYAVIRKDGYTWTADLYKDGKIFYKSWLYNFRVKKKIEKEILAMGVKVLSV
jgi:hypothetical protein